MSKDFTVVGIDIEGDVEDTYGTFDNMDDAIAEAKVVFINNHERYHLSEVRVDGPYVTVSGKKELTEDDLDIEYFE